MLDSDPGGCVRFENTGGPKTGPVLWNMTSWAAPDHLEFHIFEINGLLFSPQPTHSPSLL